MEIRDSRLGVGTPKYRGWWRIFDDPDLTLLINTAYRDNLQLQAAGLRVIEAQAQLGIAVGQWYPQSQQASGSLKQNEIGSGVGFGAFGTQAGTSAAAGGASTTAGSTASSSPGSLSYAESTLGAAASWEIDFWGKFRRGIDSARLSLLASVAAYDSALVSLTAQVANTYISIRTLEKRLRIARENAKSQEEGLRIARVRYRAGATSERDVYQALSQLKATRATIPQLETTLRETRNALSVLLGRPPAQINGLLSEKSGIPSVPSKVAVGIPIDLLRRRPDIRQAEYQAAAQVNQIGIAKADLYPAFSLSGSFEVIGNNLGPIRPGGYVFLESSPDHLRAVLYLELFKLRSYRQ